MASYGDLSGGCAEWVAHDNFAIVMGAAQAYIDATAWVTRGSQTTSTAQRPEAAASWSRS
jgi:hypothetical protein